MSEKVEERAECGDEEACNSPPRPQLPQHQPRNHLLGRIEAGLAEMRGRLGRVEAGLRAAEEDGEAVRERVADLEDGMAVLEGHSFAAAREHAGVTEGLEDVELRLEAVERRMAVAAAFDKVKVKRSDTAFKVGFEDERSGDCGPAAHNNVGGRRKEEAVARRRWARSLTDLSGGGGGGEAAPPSGVAVHRRCGSLSSLSSSSCSTSSTSPPLSSPATAAFVALIENVEKSETAAVEAVEDEKKSECDTAKDTKDAAASNNSGGRRSYSRLFLDGLSLPSLPIGIMRSKSFSDVRGGGSGGGSKQKPATAFKVGKSERSEAAAFKAAVERPSSHLLVIDTTRERPDYPIPLQRQPQQRQQKPPLRSNSMKQGKNVKISRQANMSWNAADFRERSGSSGGRDTRSLSSRTGSLASLGSASSPDLKRAHSVRVNAGFSGDVTFRQLLREEALLAKVGYLDLKKTSGFTRGTYKTYWCALSREAVFYVFPFKSGSSADRMLKAKHAFDLKAEYC